MSIKIPKRTGNSKIDSLLYFRYSREEADWLCSDHPLFDGKNSIEERINDPEINDLINLRRLKKQEEKEKERRWQEEKTKPKKDLFGEEIY